MAALETERRTARAVRYLDWLRGAVTLDFGTSHAYDNPIVELVAERLAVTLPLALLAMALTVVLALAAGLTPRRATTAPAISA